MYSYRLPSDEAARVTVATLSPVANRLGFLGKHDVSGINEVSLATASGSIQETAHNVIPAVSSSFFARMPEFSNAAIGDKVVITNMAATAARILPAVSTEYIAGVASIALNANESAILVRYNASNWIRI